LLLHSSLHLPSASPVGLPSRRKKSGVGSKASSGRSLTAHSSHPRGFVDMLAAVYYTAQDKGEGPK
ncbi:unnamed protein product, partial [Ectocarpus sp. 12 AP-2014]